MNTDTYPNIYDFPKCCNVAICGDIHGDFNLLVNKVEQEEAVNCFRSLYLWVDLQLQSQRQQFRQSCELLSFFVPLG